MKSEVTMEKGRPFRGKHYGGDYPELMGEHDDANDNSMMKTTKNNEEDRLVNSNKSPTVTDSTFLSSNSVSQSVW